MRPIFAALFVVAVIVAGGYYYQYARSACRIPVLYDIGTIDPRFSLTEEEARAAVTDAESLWEDATGKNLFTYTPGSAFTINFVYDERQELTNKEEDARHELDEKEVENEAIRSEYREMIDRYESLKAAYEEQVAEYDAALKEHNDEVERWNKKGGAPEEKFEELEKEQIELTKERDALNQTANDLNRLVKKLNELGEEGNDAIQDYNSDVAWYNSFFGGGREFTQGDYQGDLINIYQFDDVHELRRVLAHELGHALSLEHVEDSASVMYYFMEGMFSDYKLSQADIAEFHRACGE